MLFTATASAQPLDSPVPLWDATKRQTEVTRIADLIISPLGDCKIFRLRLRQELKTGLFCDLKFD